IYGIISAFKHGKVPSNDQIDVALNSFLESQALSRPSEKLSADGKLLVQDLKEVVQQSKNLILSKNQGDLIQDFIWQTTQYEYKSITAPGAPVDKDTAKRDGDEALKGLRTLGTLIITNGQFRKLLKDFSILVRDIAGDAASNAANKVRPSEEQLGQLDEAAPDNTWHEKPDLSKNNLKKQAQNVYGGNAKKDAKDVAQAGIQASNIQQSNVQQSNVQQSNVQQSNVQQSNVQQSNVQQPNVLQPNVQQPNVQQSNAAAEVDRQAAQSAVKQVTEDKIDQNVDDETKQKVKERNAEYRRRARSYFDKKMPKERKDQIIFRLKKMILECQQHTDYMEAIQTCSAWPRTTAGMGVHLDPARLPLPRRLGRALPAAEADLRTIIERFANGTSTEDLWASIAQIYKDAEHDEELRNWFKTVDAYVRRCLLEQGYILEDESTRRLFHDLGNDEYGKAVFKPHLLKDLTEVVIPGRFGEDCSDNFMPNVFEIASENYVRLGRKKFSNKHKHNIEVKASGIQLDLRDVGFHIKRKQGFPSITDTGVADIILPGNGFLIQIEDLKDKQHYFKIDKVDVDFKDLKLKVIKSNHKLLLTLFKPLALRAIRPVLQKVVETAIKQQFDRLDALFHDVKLEVDNMVTEAKGDPENAPNIYKRYSTAFQKRLTQHKEKAKEKAKKATADKKFNMAITKEDSIFPNVDLPGGISSKATEYRELARKGEKWERPSVFDWPPQSTAPAFLLLQRLNARLTQRQRSY
ncbi:unnamed protein product, partial [Clonostachys rosea f. rosea IK726]